MAPEWSPSSARSPSWRQGSISRQQESFEQRETRQMALSILDSPELLMLVAESEGDSIAGQRRRFTRMLCGFDDEDDAASATSKKTPKKKDRDQAQ